MAAPLYLFDYTLLNGPMQLVNIESTYVTHGVYNACIA